MDPVSFGLFWLLAAAALVSGAVVVTHRNPVGSVFALIVNSASLAGIYLVLGDRFLAAIQVIVYSGAILVLFLFVIMLLDLRELEQDRPRPGPRRAVAGALVAGFALLLALAWAAGLRAGPARVPAGAPGGMNELADVLFSRYLLAFEAVSVLLLAAMVGVVVLTRKGFAPPPPDSEGERP